MQEWRRLLQVLMIQADRSGDDSISWGQHPAQDRDKVHAIEHQPIADGQPFVLTDIRYAGR